MGQMDCVARSGGEVWTRSVPGAEGFFGEWGTGWLVVILSVVKIYGG